MKKFKKLQKATRRNEMRKKPWQNDNNSQLIKKFCFGENKKERKNVPEKK